MVEVRFHRRAGCCPAVPVDGHHAKLGRQYRLRRYGAWRRIRLHSCHHDSRPITQLVGICRHCPDAHFDLRATIQATEAKLRLIGRASRMPRRTIHMPAPLDGVIADFDGRVIRGFGHGGPHGRGQAVRIPVRAEVGVRLHHKAKRSLRHAMVTIGRGGRAALAASQCGATRDAFYLLRLTHGSVILNIIQSD